MPKASAATSNASGGSAAPPTAATDSPHRDVWIRTAAVLGVGIAILIAMFWGAASGAVRVWNTSPTFNHCFLILPIVGYLVWIRREHLLAMAPTPSYLALAGIPLIGVVWLIADVTDILMFQQFALVGLVQCFVIAVVGWRAARVIAFALFFVLFAVPFGKFMVAPLQDFTAVFVVEWLRLIGIPVYLEGIFLSIPTGNFEVAETCSGVRFLIATIALGVLFSHLYLRSWRRRAAFLLLSLAVPIIANGFRGFGIVMLAHTTNNKIAVGVDHLVYGWIFFSFVTVILLFIGMKMRDDDRDADMAPLPERTRGHGKGVLTTAFMAILLAGVAPAYSAYIDKPVSAAMGGLELPAYIGQWTRLEAHEDQWQPRFPGADAVRIASYRKGDQQIHLFVAYYTHQRQGAEVGGDANRIVGKHWSRAADGKRDVDLGPSGVIQARWTRALVGNKRRLIWDWHWIGGSYASDRYRAKMLEARAKMFGMARNAAGIAIAIDVDDPRDAESALKDFASRITALEDVLVKTGDAR